MINIKKVVLLFLIIIFYILFSVINVFSFSKLESFKSSINSNSAGISQDVIPIRNKKGKLSGLNIIYKIPINYDKKEIVFCPNIFDSVYQYASFQSNNKIKINIKIINQSLNEYYFEKNSLIVQTNDITKLGINDNFKNDGIVGFDNRIIYNYNYINRSYNSALRALFNNNEFCDLSDTSVNNKLVDIGYNGINELDKYYIDFYNKKYNCNYDDLAYFDYSVINEIFSGDVSDFIESNSDIIRLSYDFFYNKLIAFGFGKQKINDDNSENYSIGAYMHGKNIENNFNKHFYNIGVGKTVNNYLFLYINKKYNSLTFNDYKYNGYIEFRFKKINIDFTMKYFR